MDAARAAAGPARRPIPRALIAAARPAQWVKNAIILVPAIFALRATDSASMGRALAATAAFCLLSSATYLGNDIADRQKDRAHPDKRYRPLASGELSVPFASLVAALFACLGLAVALGVSGALVLVALGYLVLQIAYSSVLKGVPVLDVFAIAAGFVLRVVAGAAAVDVPISNWLYLTTLFLALFLALEKRRAEMTLMGSDASQHREILSEYSVGLLDQLVAIAASGAVITYSLYTLAPETVRKFGTDRLKLTIPFVLYGIFRYLYLVHRHNAGGQPERVLVRDRGMQLTVLGYAVVVAWAIYTRKP